MQSMHQPEMRLVAENTVYKRQPSRDLFAMDGVELNSAPTTGSLSAVPPWQLSLPHVCVALMSAILFGYHLGVVNIPLQYIARDLEFSDSSIAQGFVVSICLIGAFGGCAISGMVADWLGRRRAFQISTVPMILGTALSAIAPILAVMLIGRLLVGIGLGIGGPVLSLYISEISPTEIRGMYGSLSQIATCCGILGSLLAGLPISIVPGWWRACFWIATVPAALLLLGMEFCAESPRWLFKKSRWYEAEHELERLWGLSYAKTGMVNLVQNEESEDEHTTSSWADLLDKRYIRVVMIGSALFALQQLSGINAIFYFSTTVFKKAGVSSDVAASVCVGVINLLGSCIAAYLMDRKGRRSLLIWSFSGMACAMAMQAAVGSLHAASSLQGSISLLATSLYVFMFAVGAGPVPALLLPEIFPNAIRAKAMSVAMCVHWVGNVLIGLTYLDLLHHLGAATLYSFFTAVCLLAALFVKKNVLETKGRSLEDIETLLLSGL